MRRYCTSKRLQESLGVLEDMEMVVWVDQFCAEHVFDVRMLQELSIGPNAELGTWQHTPPLFRLFIILERSLRTLLVWQRGCHLHKSTQIFDELNLYLGSKIVSIEIFGRYFAISDQQQQIFQMMCFRVSVENSSSLQLNSSNTRRYGNSVPLIADYSTPLVTLIDP